MSTVLVKTEAKKEILKGGKSKSQLKIEARISVLEEKKSAEGLTPHEARILENNKYKIESRSASKLYKESKSLGKERLNDMLGKSKFPTFQEFTDLLPKKELYSMWDALGVLTKLNKALTQRSTASNQQKKENVK